MMIYPNGDRHCAMAQGQVLSACGLQLANDGVHPGDCCYVINDVNREVQTQQARIWLCKCFQEAIKVYGYTKLIGMPEKCNIPNAVPFDPNMDCAQA
ncbi:hypothetical protein CARUB_v10002421mg [Capsella rubella]|uniref:Bifunctional inhibitor/plant lipid transfer protein/seed storage helical domain-containing protein n=2 Tax=Capsella rubella TaxID=81985 RepID=R0HAB7_9BRAS|nr:hypothetical protein CARUB_v10002421mg [Capsella rubella]